MKLKCFNILAGVALTLAATTVVGSETEKLKINAEACARVEDNTRVLVQLMQMGFTDEQIEQRAAIGMEYDEKENDHYLAWFMTGTARNFIKQQLNSTEITELNKQYPKYTRSEVVGMRMKQLCLVNEGSLYDVPQRPLSQ